MVHYASDVVKDGTPKTFGQILSEKEARGRSRHSGRS